MLKKHLNTKKAQHGWPYKKASQIAFWCSLPALEHRQTFDFISAKFSLFEQRPGSQLSKLRKFKRSHDIQFSLILYHQCTMVLLYCATRLIYHTVLYWCTAKYNMLVSRFAALLHWCKSCHTWLLFHGCIVLHSSSFIDFFTFEYYFLFACVFIAEFAKSWF